KQSQGSGYTTSICGRTELSVSAWEEARNGAIARRASCRRFKIGERNVAAVKGEGEFVVMLLSPASPKSFPEAGATLVVQCGTFDVTTAMCSGSKKRPCKRRR